MAGQPIKVIISPLISIEPIGKEADVSGYAALVFTSENAVNSARYRHAPKAMLAFCVGEHTAEAAELAGFRVRIADNSSESLIELIKREHAGGPLLHLRGQHVAQNIADMLVDTGLQADEATVYDQVRCTLNSKARKAVRSRPCVFPVFSPRTARILSEELTGMPDRGHMVCCLSRNVADAFGTGFKTVVASQPTSRSLLALALDTAIVRDAHSAGA